MAASQTRKRKPPARTPRKNNRRSRFNFWRTKKNGKGFMHLSAIKLLPPLLVVGVLTSGGLYSLHYSSAQASPQSVGAKAVSHTVESLRRQTIVPKPSPTPAPTPAPTTTPPPTAAPTPAPSTPTPVAVAKTAPGKPAGSLSAPSQTTSTPPPTQAPSGSSGSSLPPATSSYTSSNWSGYFMNTASYTAVSGAWKATDPTGNGSSTSADATWIGIGGVNTQDLIQVGTENTVSASGQISAAAFYELLPASPVYPSSMTVTPGDSMSASIRETSTGQWTISITDVTTGKTFSTSVAYTSGYASAEWIQEDPSYSSGGLVPFDNFGTASFTNASAGAGSTTYSLLSGNANAITLVDSSNNPLATPSILGSDGASFNVTRN